MTCRGFVLFSLFLGLITSARAEEMKPADMAPVFISISHEVRLPLSDTWKKERCKIAMSAFSGGGACDISQNPAVVEAAKASGKYKFHVEILHGKEQEYLVHVENWKPADDLEFGKVGWKIKADDRVRADFYLRKRLIDFEGSVRVDRLQRERVVALGAKFSETIAVDEATGMFVEKDTKKALTFDEAQTKFVAEKPKHKHLLRASIEIAAILGVGWYLYNYPFHDLNVGDEDFSGSWADQRDKILYGKGWRMDNNQYILNAGHAFAGTIYYNFARTNGFNSIESLLLTIAGSFLWETIVEYHEVLSIDDMIITPLGGAAIGEVFYQLGTFFEGGGDTWANKIFGSFFSAGFSNLHRWMDKDKLARAKNLDKYGFNANVWHDFQLYAGGGVTSQGNSNSTFTGQAKVGVQTEIITVPGYGKPGKSAQFFADTKFSQLVIDASGGPQGLDEFRFFAKAALFGYYKQDIQIDANEKYRGYSFYLGASNGEDLSLQRTKGRQDQWGIVNVIGPTLDMTFYYKGLRVRTVVDVFGDFAQVRSYAVDKYFAANGYDQLIEDARNDPNRTAEVATGRVTGTKSILENDRSYFAVGLTANAKLVIDYSNFEIGGQASAEMFTSIQGADRFQHVVTDDTRLKDARYKTSIWVAYRIPKTNMALKLQMDDMWRIGTAGGLTNEDKNKTYTGSVLFRF